MRPAGLLSRCRAKTKRPSLPIWPGEYRLECLFFQKSGQAPIPQRVPFSQSGWNHCPGPLKLGNPHCVKPDLVGFGRIGLDLVTSVVSVPSGRIRFDWAGLIGAKALPKPGRGGCAILSQSRLHRQDPTWPCCNPSAVFKRRGRRGLRRGRGEMPTMPVAQPLCRLTKQFRDGAAEDSSASSALKESASAATVPRWLHPSVYL